MRWPTWWQLLVVLQARSLAQSVTPTVCEEDACRCDSFTKVICNCTRDYDDMTLRPDGAYRVPTMTSAIIIDGCARVTFLPDTIRHLIQLRSVEIRNVQSVNINEQALLWSPYSRDSEMNPGIRLIIHNSTVAEIASHAVQGRFDDILISDSKISVLKPFAFSSLNGVKNIGLSRNTFNNIETQAFKKFTTLNFFLRGGAIKTLPSRFLSDMEVTNLFQMDGVHVINLHSLTFLVSSPKRVLIENNNIDLLTGDAFHMVTRGPITFRNNTVRAISKGAFLGFTVHPEVTSTFGAQELLIDNNTVTELTPASLAYNRTTLAMRVDGLNLNVPCVCEAAEEWRAFLKEQGTVRCWYALDNHYVSLPTYMDSRCGAFKQNYWIFIVIGVMLVFIVAAAVVIFFIVRREKERKKKIQIVMPDGKTYRETEFHIVVERAELLTTDL